jgi:hypothetical protein
MKILFVMDSPEYLRFYDSVVVELATRGHFVWLAVMSERERKPVGLGGLQQYADHVEVLGVVPEHLGLWGNVAFGLRATMDFVRYLHPDFAEASALRMRIKQRFLPKAYHWLDRIPRLSAGGVRLVQGLLAVAERAIPTCGPIEDFVARRAPDVLLISPLVAAASPQVDWVKAARKQGIRTAVCIASWDNLTNKGMLRIEPDLVLVWNDVQKREAHEYHYVPEHKIVATGAQLFDKWFNRQPTRDREAFCARVGLPDARPFLLFTGSSGFISKSAAEVEFIRRWIESVRGADEPLLREINVLVRPHPYNCHAWGSQPLADLPGVAVHPSAPYSPVDPANREDYFDSLYHSAAVIGVNTSAMVEASIVGRPVLSIRAPEHASTQGGTLHFRYLLPEHGGPVAVADSFDAHVAQIAERLRRPEQFREQIDRFVASFIRPCGVDRPATPIFVDALEGLARQRAPLPVTVGVWRYAVLPILLVAAVPVFIVNNATRKWKRAVKRGWRRTVRFLRWLPRLTFRALRRLVRAGIIRPVRLGAHRARALLRRAESPAIHTFRFLRRSAKRTRHAALLIARALVLRLVRTVRMARRAVRLGFVRPVTWVWRRLRGAVFVLLARNGRESQNLTGSMNRERSPQPGQPRAGADEMSEPLN